MPVTLADGTPVHPARARRGQNRRFSTIELKSSDGDSWYNALILDVRRRWSTRDSCSSRPTRSRRSMDTTQASTFFSDATNGTTTAFPEFVPDYNKGPSDFDARHNWVVNFTWELPFARGLSGRQPGALLDGWQLSGIVQVRSGNPLTVFVQTNRSRSQWRRRWGRASAATARATRRARTARTRSSGSPEQWFDPTAFVLQPAGTFGNTGRGDFTGPDLQTVDLALVKGMAVPRLCGSWAPRAAHRSVQHVQPRELRSARPDRVRRRGRQRGAALHLRPHPTTVTSSRQIQIGLRLGF